MRTQACTSPVVAGRRTAGTFDVVANVARSKRARAAASRETWRVPRASRQARSARSSELDPMRVVALSLAFLDEETWLFGQMTTSSRQ
jgi:hypothetical protein